MSKIKHSLSILPVLIVLPFCYGGFYGTYTKLQDHAPMSKHTYRKVAARSLVECLAECQRSAACRSFNYNQNICHLNTNNTDLDSVRSRGYFTLGTMAPIDGNPKHPCATSSLEGTSNKNTKSSKGTTGKGSGHKTLPGRSGCSEEFQGCGEPPTLPGADKAYDGHYLDAAVNYTCQGGYLNCLNKTRSVCKATGKWDYLSGLCMVYLWLNPPAYYPFVMPCTPTDKVLINITGTLTEPTNATVNVRCTRGIAMYLSLRYRFGQHEKKICVASKLDRKWSEQIIVSKYPFVLGKEFNMIITKKPSTISVEVDGVHVIDYPSKDKVGALAIKHAMSVQKLQYIL